MTTDEQSPAQDPSADVATADDASTSANAEVAGDSSGEKHRGPVVLRGRTRWVRTWSHLPLPAPSTPPIGDGTVVLITGNFDLSVASVAALAAALFIIFTGPLGVVGGLALTILVAAAVGLLNGVIVQLVGINAFIVTLGTLTAIRGLVLIVTGGRSLSVDNPGLVTSLG